jgi:hypothetical protein
MAAFSSRISILVFLTVLGAFTSPVRAEDCPLPGAPPEMPQGASASDEEMKEGREKLQIFVNKLEDYQKCMDHLIETAPPGTTPEQKQIWVAKSNMAFDAAHQWAEIYSAQLRAFKARQQ